jgi:hypothetical protein
VTNLAEATGVTEGAEANSTDMAQQLLSMASPKPSQVAAISRANNANANALANMFSPSTQVRMCFRAALGGSQFQLPPPPAFSASASAASLARAESIPSESEGEVPSGPVSELPVLPTPGGSFVISNNAQQDAVAPQQQQQQDANEQQHPFGLSHTLSTSTDLPRCVCECLSFGACVFVCEFM